MGSENVESVEEQQYETDLTQDSVKTYLAEIGKNTLLKQDEEKSLAMELEISEEISSNLNEETKEITITEIVDWFNNSKSTFLESKNSLDQLVKFNKLEI